MTETLEDGDNVDTQPQENEVYKLTPKEEAEQILKTMQGDMTYGIADFPPWYLSLLLGLQHYLTMFGSTVAISLLLADALCITKSDPVRSELIATIFFVSGLVTILQVLFGVRLPVVHGGSFAFLVATLAFLALPEWSCPATETIANMTSGERRELWQVRMREIQGSIAVASCFLVVGGFTGIVGILLRFTGPLAIAPTISLVGLSLFVDAGHLAGSHWGISFLTMVLVILFSQYMKNIYVPCCVWTRKEGCHVTTYPLFTLLPVVIAITFAWLLCYVLTVAEVLPNNPESYGYQARTDTRLNLLSDSKWFDFPYPGQWGLPTVSLAGVFGMFAAVLVVIVTSVGDYYASARLSGAPNPPMHAINRGIAVQGIGCILAGVWGTGNGTSTYIENTGTIAITKVGSRIVIIAGAVIMMLLGMFGKFGAFFATIPDPILGGMFCIVFGIITAVGISNLQFVDLNSSRNLFIIGFSFFMGILVPTWMKNNEGIIDTGVRELDQIITVLLSTGMFIGGMIGFLFDNTIPGTEAERGIIEWRKLYVETDGENEERVQAVKEEVLKSYEFPFGNNWIHKWAHITKYMPVCPTFIGMKCKCNCNKCKREHDSEDEEVAPMLVEQTE
ncbi:solute carrier family 23 member 1-like [Saccoglossus kowalevskii]